MKKTVYMVILTLLICIFAPVSAVCATTPTDELRGPVDEVIGILKDPKYQQEGERDAQRERIWKIIREIFDFKKIGELALGKYRKKFNPSQMESFSDVFSELLGETYLKKVQTEYNDEKVTYLAEKIKTGSKYKKAVVKTEIVRQNLKIPVNYSMWLNNGRWRIFDVKVEGVSLVKNYRTQFQKILINKTPDELIEQLKTKVENSKKKER